MGERAYIIKREGEEWKTVYSHWGAGYLYRGLKEIIQKWQDYVSKTIAGEGETLEPFNAFKELEELINDIWNYEVENGEEITTIEKPSDFIVWDDIVIEAWVIYEPSKFIAIYKPAIILDGKTGVLMILEKPLLNEMENKEIVRVIQKFLNASHVVYYVAYGIKKNLLTPETAQKIFWYYVSHEGYDVKMPHNIHLIIEKPPQQVLDILDRKIKLLLY